VRSYVSRLEQADWNHVNELFAEMETDARALLSETGADPSQIAVRRSADMRYVGQGFEVTVDLPDGALSGERSVEVREKFYATYRQLFERHVTDVAVEALSWRLAATGPVPNLELNFGGQPTVKGNARTGTRPVWFPETGIAPCPVLSRYALAAGLSFEGPAVIEERESTTVVGPGARVTVDEHLTLIIDLEEPR
jgi:N-methylhydantoinase A